MTGIPEAERKTLQVTAARYIFRTAIASRNLDLWDFQHALFALLGAECYDEAAIRFVHSFPALIGTSSFEPLSLLFLAMNSEQTHAKITDPAASFLMLHFEVQLRVQDAGNHDDHRLLALIRRMHACLKNSASSISTFGRPMLYVAILSVRIRVRRDSTEWAKPERCRVNAPLNSAVRAALAGGDLGLLANVLHFFNELYPLVTRPNMELLKDALLRLPKSESMPISAHGLIMIYATYVSDSLHDDVAMRRVESHSALFRAMRRDDAYFACEFAAATIMHDGRKSYRQARERLQVLMSPAARLQLSAQSVAHGLEFIGGTYWAEGDYAKSAEYFQMVLHADFGSSGLHQITCERLCDSLVFLGRHEDAARIVLADLRSGHRDQAPEQQARLYARLAYAYAELGRLRKAAISCLRLCRVASLSGSDAVDVLAGILAGWVLGHFRYSDPAIPESTTNLIRDITAISDVVSSEELSKWRGGDPFRSKRIVLVATVFELLGVC